MLSHGPQCVIWLLDKTALFASPSVGFVVAQGGNQALPGWLNGTIAGGVILVLLYLLKYTIGLWQSKDRALNEAKDARIKQLEEHVEKCDRELRELRDQQNR